jgi:hypothetical protein
MGRLTRDIESWASQIWEVNLAEDELSQIRDSSIVLYIPQKANIQFHLSMKILTGMSIQNRLFLFYSVLARSFPQQRASDLLTLFSIIQAYSFPILVMSTSPIKIWI